MPPAQSSLASSGASPRRSGSSATPRSGTAASSRRRTRGWRRWSSSSRRSAPFARSRPPPSALWCPRTPSGPARRLPWPTARRGRRSGWWTSSARRGCRLTGRRGSSRMLARPSRRKPAKSNDFVKMWRRGGSATSGARPASLEGSSRMICRSSARHSPGRPWSSRACARTASAMCASSRMPLAPRLRGRPRPRPEIPPW
mmetsp:Transcript_100923/g.323934  ORF Transcript_100923/g.323934 Transcript_100923/m.323934 type:complete len:200 (-) Transcript_100923:773-1372(-)